MIANDNELQVTLERIARMQRQVAELRHKEINPHNYRLSVSGYLAEIDRMQLDVREFLQHHPTPEKSRPIEKLSSNWNVLAQIRGKKKSRR